MRLICAEGGSNKFWEGEVKGARLTVRWGKVGSEGQTKTTVFTDAAGAEAELDKLLREKRKKGYIEQGAELGASSQTDKGPNRPEHINDLISRLDCWFAANRPEYYRHLRPGAAPKTLQAVEKKIGRALPRTLRALLEWRNGEKPAAEGRLFENWSLMQSKEIADLVQGMNQMEKAGEFDFEGWWRAGSIPFLENGGGDHLCVDSDSGEVLEFWHDEPWRTATAPTLDAWLEIFVTTLEADAWESEDSGYFGADSRPIKRARKTLAAGYPKKRVLREKGEMPEAPVAPAAGTGTMDRETAQRLIAAWGKWIGRPLSLPENAPYLVRTPERWLDGGCPNFFEYDPDRGALIVRFHVQTHRLQAIKDPEQFPERLRNEKSPSLSRAKAWLEAGEPVLDFNPNSATILARRDFLDSTISEEKFVKACSEMSNAAYLWSEKNRFFE